MKFINNCLTEYYIQLLLRNLTQHFSKLSNQGKNIFTVLPQYVWIQIALKCTNPTTFETFLKNNKFKYFFPWVNNMHDYFDMYPHVTHSMMKLPVSSFKRNKTMHRIWTGCSCLLLTTSLLIYVLRECLSFNPLTTCGNWFLCLIQKRS